MAIARSTRARVLCPAGRRHTLTTHLACLRLASSTAPGAATLRNHPQPSAWPLSRCGYLRRVISPLLRVALPQTKARPRRPQRTPGVAAARSHPQSSAWPLQLPACASGCQKSCSRPARRAREAPYLLFHASPCLKLKLALVVLSVLRALPQPAAIRSHQPGRCSYLRVPAAIRNPAAGGSRAVEACASSSSPRSPVVLRPTAAAPRRSPRRQLPVVVWWYVHVARVVVQLV
jgi:hypothetical protein